MGTGTAELRAEGYRTALRRAGITPCPAWERPVRALHRGDGARAMFELLDSGDAPDAVFAFSDELALGALHTAYVRGLRVPEDLAVVGLDDIEDGRFGRPTLTPVSPDKRQIAARALQCRRVSATVSVSGVPQVSGCPKTTVMGLCSS